MRTKSPRSSTLADALRGFLRSVELDSESTRSRDSGVETMIQVEHDGFVYALVRHPAQGVQRLSPREREIATLVAEGLGNKTIAIRLGIRPGSVSTYLRRIFVKLGIDSRAALAQRSVVLS